MVALRQFTVRTFMVVTLLLSATGCATHRIESAADEPAVPPPAGPAHTALLPFSNESNTVDAPEIVRKFLFQEAARRGWAVQPLDETDRRLREQLQITDGGQLPGAEAADLGKALEVGTLVFGDVQEWKKITTGIYNTVIIKVAVKLVDAQSGAVRWERTQEVKRDVKIDAREPGASILAGIVVNLFLNPMTPYARQLAHELGPQLPPPP